MSVINALPMMWSHWDKVYLTKKTLDKNLKRLTCSLALTSPVRKHPIWLSVWSRLKSIGSGQKLNFVLSQAENFSYQESLPHRGVGFSIPQTWGTSGSQFDPTPRETLEP